MGIAPFSCVEAGVCPTFAPTYHISSASLLSHPLAEASDYLQQICLPSPADLLLTCRAAPVPARLSVCLLGF